MGEGEGELLALYWTVAGPADVHVGREWSTFEWRDRCAEAQRVGFKGLGLWHADIEHQLQTRSLAEMKQIFDDAGLTYLQVEFLADFFVPEGEPARAESDSRRKLVSGASAENGGLAIDTWHCAKLRIAPADLRQIPPQHFTWVELSDGQRQNMPDLVDETVNHRRLPGEGEFDIPASAEVCRAAGYQGPWGVEVLSAELRSLPIEEEFQRAYETTAAQLRAGVA